MSLGFYRASGWTLLLLAGWAGAQVRGADAVAELRRYTQGEGKEYFALSIRPNQPLAEPAAVESVVLFDTSASQTGAYREKALAVLERFLAACRDADRVHLVGLDLKAIPLTASFVAPRSPEMQSALTQLRERVPLGTSDMAAGLRQSLDAFVNSTAGARNILYLGDGMSVARLVSSDEFRQLCETLVERRIAASCLAVGPQLDLQLLGALANHTGGLCTVDDEEAPASQVGPFLAQATRAAVYWPQQVAWPAGVDRVYPHNMPPLRSDRDAVVIGTGLPQAGEKLVLEVEAAGAAQTLQAQMPEAASDEAHAYLATLVELAAKTDGYGLPTAGSAWLNAARDIVSNQVSALNTLAQTAAATGNAEGAETLAGRAALLNPHHQATRNLQAALVTLRQVPGQGRPAPSAAGTVPEELPSTVASDDPLADEGALLSEVEQRNQVLTGFMQTQVRTTINDARSIMQHDPEAALSRLKLTQEAVSRTQELSPEIRNQLLSQLENALRETSRRAFIKQEMELRAKELEASAEDRRQLARDLYLREQKLDQLMKRFNALMDEERYHDAALVARAAQDLAPNNPVFVQADLHAQMVGYWHEARDQRDRRRLGYVEALAAVERSHIPISDEPPILYPDPEVWRRLSKRRKESAAVDLSVKGPAEEKISKALEQKVTVEFDQEPLEEVINFFATVNDSNIPIQLDRKALDEAGVLTDSPVDMHLTGVSMRSALRLLLDQLDLTYLVKDEVLYITTTEAAKEYPPVIKVYPVADLVVPIISGGAGGGGIGGGFGGGGGGLGGGGGGFGGGGGGFGGGGGGFGGGGGGLGGGGGFFNVPRAVGMNMLNQGNVPGIPGMRRGLPALPGGGGVF